ncbi:uncharacterized protein [Periplaneta americana]|uniref:uncharacterized protein isoform X2 n=1 Tax=Periplaneta americana TaxID=6978 RepID=UPI0037E89ABC
MALCPDHFISNPAIIFKENRCYVNMRATVVFIIFLLLIAQVAISEGKHHHHHHHHFWKKLERGLGTVGKIFFGR